jgi:hypothetical protein
MKFLICIYIDKRYENFYLPIGWIFQKKYKMNVET